MAEKTKLTRHACREKTFALLFAKDFDQEADAAVFYDIQVEGADLPNDDSIRSTFLAVCENLADIDREIEETSMKWKLSRMSTATRSMLRLAVYEMLMGSVPAKVVINEAVEIIKVYDDEAAPAFLNGILNKIARNRGLIAEEE